MSAALPAFVARGRRGASNRPTGWAQTASGPGRGPQPRPPAAAATPSSRAAGKARPGGRSAGAPFARTPFVAGLILALAPLAALAQSGQTAGELTARGAPASTDILPCAPSPGTVTKACTAGGLVNLATSSINNFAGVDPTGVLDSTLGIQAAIATGAPLTCNGIYKTSATLKFILPANAGQIVTGVGPTGTGFASNPTANRCIIRPTSAVTVAILVDGTANSGYVTGTAFENLTVDMANMAVNTIGFEYGQSWNNYQLNVAVINDLGKQSWYLGAGAFITHLDNIVGTNVSCIGTGVQDPTTLEISTPNIRALNITYCANVTTIGGAIQFQWDSGVTTVQYVPPGLTGMLGGFPSTTTGIYIALGSYITNAQKLTSLGTDWEIIANPPATCTLTGAAATAFPGWAYGTYNDGTHGCLPIQWAYAVEANTQGCFFSNPNFAGLYLKDENSTNGCVIENYELSGTTQESINNATQVFTAPVLLSNAQAIRGYSDTVFGAQTFLIDASDGQFQFEGGQITAAANGSNFFTLSDAGAAHTIFACYAGGSRATDACDMANLALYYDDAATIKTIQLNGQNGQINAYSGQFSPTTDADAVLYVKRAGGNTLLDCATNGTPECVILNGYTLAGYSDNFSTLQWSISGANGAASLGQITSNSTVTGKGLITAPVAFAALPASPVAGERATVNNTSACTFGSAVNGSGSSFCPVVYTGSSWVAG